MDRFEIALISIPLLLGMIFLRVPIGLAMLLCGIGGTAIVTDRWVPILASLKSLDLDTAPVRDEGVAVLCEGLSQLRELDLSRTLVTGNVVDSLERMSQLERLMLTGTRIGFQPLKRLSQANPNFDLAELLTVLGRARRDSAGGSRGP